jgi:hypothetical protein
VPRMVTGLDLPGHLDRRAVIGLVLALVSPEMTSNPPPLVESYS